jgi:hypothetical protein
MNEDKILVLDPKNKDFLDDLQFAFNNNYKIPIVNKHKHLKNPYLLLSKEDSKKKEGFDKFMNEIRFTLNNYKISKKGLCTNYIILTDETIKTLDYYTKIHKFKSNNGKTNQKEISGIFNLCPIGDNMIEVRIDNESIDTGELESANHRDTIGSFHTHPLDAYIKHNVCMAFPSADDYFTTLHIYASGYGVFHIVSTIEGLYIITIKKSFMKEKKEKILKNFEKYKNYIEDKYGLDYPVCNIKKDNNKFWKKTIESYLKKMNRLKYFKIQFVFWKDASKPIKIVYGKINNNCLISDKQIDIMNKINI